jgi:hypothetical protein
VTDTSQLNRLLDRARGQAEGELPALAAVYEKALTGLAVDAARTFTSLTAATWQPEPEGALLRAIDALAASVAVTQHRIQTRILKLVAGGPLTRLGIAWDVKHPLSKDLLARAGGRTGERLGAAATPILRETVAQAYEQGLSVPDTAALIRSALTAAAPWQAEMLARTDLNGLSNGGSVIAATLAGAGYKTWLATMDDRTRDTHAEADGQTVPVAHAFLVGGEQLEFPGDPQGSDAEVANCRCTVTYGDSLQASASGRAPMSRLSSRVTMAAALADTRALTAATLAQTKWVSDLAFEGEATSDGRYMLPRSLKARELPLTLMAQTVTDDGHDGAFVAGRIDTISRRGMNIDGDPLAEGVMSMRGTGIFDMGGENGADIARLVGDQILRGVSVDLGILDWCFRDPSTGELIQPEDMTDDQWEQAFFGELQYAVKKAEILAATVCPTPAFANARIALTASGSYQRVLRVWAPIKAVPVIEEGVGAEDGRVVSPLTASAAPAKPPREWFETQEPPGEMPLTITDDGRIFGHIALWRQCHTGIANVCTTPPRSASGYAYFHVGELELEDGEKIAVGKLMLASRGGKHAPLSASRAEAASHYDDTSMVAGYLRAADGQHGIWVAGALNPALSADRVRELRTLPPSGDWRAVNGRLDMIAALAVPIPGFPIPRAEAALIASAEEITFSALVASSGSFDPQPLVIRALVAAGLIPDDPAEDSKTRALVARAEGGIDGLLALATEGD